MIRTPVGAGRGSRRRDNSQNGLRGLSKSCASECFAAAGISQLDAPRFRRGEGRPRARENHLALVHRDVQSRTELGAALLPLALDLDEFHDDMSTVLDISTDGFPLRVHPWAADALLVVLTLKQLTQSTMYCQ